MVQKKKIIRTLQNGAEKKAVLNCRRLLVLSLCYVVNGMALRRTSTQNGFIQQPAAEELQTESKRVRTRHCERWCRAVVRKENSQLGTWPRERILFLSIRGQEEESVKLQAKERGRKGTCGRANIK